MSLNFEKRFDTLEQAQEKLTTKVTNLEKRSPSQEREEREDQRQRDLSPSVKIEPKEKNTSTSSEKDRFRVEELGYFDGTGDVYAFVDRIETVARVKTGKLVKDHVVLSFMNPSGSNEAYNWWTSELTSNGRKDLIYGSKTMAPLCDALISRFGTPEHQLLKQLNQIRYTRKDAAEQKPATAFVGQVITLAKRLGHTPKQSLQLAFTHFEAAL